MYTIIKAIDGKKIEKMEEPELPLLKKTTLMNKTRKDKLLNPLLIILVRCLIMARRLHACKMDLKFSKLRNILLI